ncbi:thiol reductant ABC exporter subunit CydD [Desulfuribacillus alkaliarsenatis]|uniref:Thiol reductant ABC exporter subunit CydD n=1 Tax=Desulfuribacillus alkaliarsenatis TaxID=766136 RepID=A0A1E5G3P0_9FIRM|nr:thiol reductant ABC exporter subunit CydD [Desulfuribacillus alkaliarsenatis]OEF97620.1 thiol reductant ABC exporter subunit CydD [Desulfuribacillus alkaliarsenatis]
MLDKRLNQEVQNHKWIFAFLVCFAVIGGVLAIGQGYMIATIVDAVFLQGQGLQSTWGMLWLLLAVFIGRGTISYGNSRLSSRLATIVKGSIRERLLVKLSKTEPGQLFRHKTGQIISVMTDAIDHLDGYYSRYLPQLLQAAIIPPMILIVVFSFNIYSGLIMLVTAPLIPVFMVIIGNMADKKARQQMDSLVRFSGHFLDVLQGLATLKIFGRSKQQRQKIVEMSNNFRDTTMDVLKIAFLSALMLEILATISTAMIAVEVGLRLVYGHLTFHTAFFILLLAPELYLPLKNLGSSFHTGRNSIAAAEKVWDVLDESDVKPVWGESDFAVADEQWQRNKRPGAIAIENVSFSYMEHIPVLKNINLNINAGERIAIIGRSGSGKTTLLKVLLGLIPPSEGRILINDIPLSSFKEDVWRANVAYVSQEPYLFSGTVAENIAIGREDASTQDIMMAGQLAGVDRFVKELSRGYDTPVGEGGRGLSGGEKQRVALARAFLKQAPIVILDEPTAGLDVETEHFLQQAMETLCQQATVITVAHRLQTVMKADRIILLTDGEIAAIGNHEQLLGSSELYRQIVSVYRGDRL